MLQPIKGALMGGYACFGILQGTQSTFVLTNFVAVKANKKKSSRGGSTSTTLKCEASDALSLCADSSNPSSAMFELNNAEGHPCREGEALDHTMLLHSRKSVPVIFFFF